MKIAYRELKNVIDVNTEMITGLVIENPEFMYKILQEFRKATEGLDSDIVVSDNETPIPAQKTIAYITDFVDFTLNQKTLISKIMSELDKKSKNELYYEKSERLLETIEMYIESIAGDLPCEIICEKLNMLAVIKAAGIEIIDDYDTLEERILAYMDLSREYEGKRLFVFVNLRSVVSYATLQLMMATAITRDYRVLLIDNMDYKKLSCESRIIIDNDLCVI